MEMTALSTAVKSTLYSAEKKPIFRFVTTKETESIGYWRMGMPFIGVHKLGFYGSFHPHVLTPLEVARLDVDSGQKTLAVVTHLSYMDGMLNSLEDLVKNHTPVVLDVDDYVWRWGRLTKSQLRNFEKTLQLASVVTTTTPYLQRKIKEHAGVWATIVPNTMPEEEFRTPVERRDEKLRVIYTGAFAHQTEWEILREIIEQTPFAEWVLFHGRQLDATKRFEQLVTPAPLSQLKNILWQVPQEPAQFLRTAYNARAHVAVAPLASTFMNRAKSDLKLLEAGALGIPCIAQDLEPYLGWDLRATDVDGFVSALKRMDEDEAYRRETAERMVDYAWDRRLQYRGYLGHLVAAYLNGGRAA